MVSTGGVVAVESERIEYVGDFGAGELSLSIAAGVGAIGGAVVERLGAVRPVIIGEASSPGALDGGL